MTEAKTLQRLWAAVVMAVIDEAIEEDRQRGTGERKIRLWANGRDGYEVLLMAGIEPGPRTTQRMVAFVKRGERTSTATAREKQAA